MRMKPRSAMFTALCLISSLAAVPAAIQAQGLSPLLEGYRVVSRTNGAPVVRSVPLAPPYMAVAFGARLAVMDMSQPSAPAEVASLDLPESPHGFSLAGNLLYVADGGHGLLVFDVSNPVAPAFVSSFTGRTALAVAVSPGGNFAYTCDGSTNLRVIKLKKPGHLKELPGVLYKKANFFDLLVAGNYLIAAAGPRGIAVYSLETPSNPVRVSRVKDLRGCRRIALHDRLLAVADDDAGFALVDFPKWDDPRLKGTLALSGLALDCAFLESDTSKVILGQGTAGFSVVDVSNADAPRLIRQSASPQPSVGVSSIGTFAYLDCGVEGLWQADLSQPENPALHKLFEGNSGWYGVAINGTTAYVAGDSQIQVWDFSDPLHPVRGAALPVPAPAVDLLVANDLLIASCQTSGVLLYDLTAPASPALVGTYVNSDTSNPGAAVQASVAGTLMAVAMSSSGAHLVDISDPASPHYMGAYKNPDLAKAIVAGVAFSATDPARLWMTDSIGGFYSLDVSNPASPTRLGKVSLDNQFGKVAAAPDYALVQLGGESGIQLVKVANPADPTKGELLAGVNAAGFVVSGSRVLLCDGQAGLKEYDISDPANPPQTALAVPPGFTSGVGLLPGGEAVVTTREGGLWALDRDSCAGADLLLPCDGQLLPRVEAPFFSWAARSGASYKLEVSIDPSFPSGNKKTRTATGKVSNNTSGAWAVTVTDWDWMIRRAAEGHQLYWRVTYTLNKVKSYSEVRTFDIQ